MMSKEQAELEAPKTDTKTLIKALRIVANDIHDPEGTTMLTILEGADRLEEFETVIEEAMIELDTSSPAKSRGLVEDKLGKKLTINKDHILLNNNRIDNYDMGNRYEVGDHVYVVSTRLVYEKLSDGWHTHKDIGKDILDKA